MKRFIFLCSVIYLAVTIQGKAQITINQSDFPEIGNLVIRAVDEVTTVNPGNPGLNQTWDFSNLIITRYDSVYYISPIGVPGYQNYPQANMVSNHNPNPASYGYNYNFINSAPTGWMWEADETLLPIWGSIAMAFHVSYVPEAYGLKLPFTYNSASSQDVIMDWIIAMRNGSTVTDSSRKISHLHMTMLGDASGTMIIPDGSFPAIRVREVLNFVDSSFSWTTGGWVFDSGTDTSYTWTQYRWYANDYGEVGFYREGSKKANGFTFFKSESVVGIQDIQNVSSLRIYPNPAQSYISIETKEKIEKVEILDMAGCPKLVSNHSMKLDIAALLPGMYMIRAYSMNRVVTGKFIKY